MRIAWLGPRPRDDGGVPALGALILQELVALGHEVDAYVVLGNAELPAGLVNKPGLQWWAEPSGGHWERWDSRAPMASLLGGQLSRLLAQRRLSRALEQRHKVRPYAAVYEFSGIELAGLRHRLPLGPPITVHPQVHAAGELAWQRREAPWARRLQPPLRHDAMAAVLTIRALAQRLALERVAHVIAPSRHFATALEHDYGVAAEKITVVPNPVDLDRFRPGADSGAANPTATATLLAPAYFAVRKGLELLVELSHRLIDLAGRVRLVVVGQPRLWSNYSGLLKRLEPRTSTIEGWIEWKRLPERYCAAAAVLVPSHYEPFALTVAEALACGTPVVASDAVGATEGVDRRCCRIFPAGSAQAFEHEVRELLADLTTDRGDLARVSRREAETHFAARQAAHRIATLLASSH